MAAKGCASSLFFVFCLSFLVAFSVFPTSAESSTLYVKAGASGRGDGTSWENAYDDLQVALDKALHGDQIWVAKGVYRPHLKDREISFVMRDGVALYGGFSGVEVERFQRDPAANVTVLSGLDVGSGSYHVVLAKNVDATAILDGFTVTGGNANGRGSNSNGGGMYNENASPTVQNCFFLDNGTRSSGHGYGGGMYNENSNPTVINCTFSGNTARGGGHGYGGGMYNYKSNPTVVNCTFSGNRAVGGALDGYRGAGGGIYNENSSPVVTNCTFYDNTVSGPLLKPAEGMHSKNGSNPIVTNCIFWGSRGTVGQFDAEKDCSAVVTYSIVDWSGVGNSIADPKLGFLWHNGGATMTHPLLYDSSARNSGLPVGVYTIAGRTVTVPDRDQRGVSRPMGDGVDIGSYEILDDVGWVTVEVAPEFVRASGACWQIGDEGWRDHGDTVPLVPGVYTVCFKNVSGFISPESIKINVKKHQIITISVVYGVNNPPSPMPDPLPDPDPTPTPTPTPPSLLVPISSLLPDGSVPFMPEPIRISLPEGADGETRLSALREAMLDAFVPDDRVDGIVELMEVDSSGIAHLAKDGLELIRRLLPQVEIPSDSVGVPLAAFRALPLGRPSSNGVSTAVIFFRVPAPFVGKEAGRVHVVKVFSSSMAMIFRQVFSIEGLQDGCFSLLDVESTSHGGTLRRVLKSGDVVNPDCFIAIALEDGGPFDLDGVVDGGVTDPGYVIEGKLREMQGEAGGSGGCNVVRLPFSLFFFILPLIAMDLRR